MGDFFRRVEKKYIITENQYKLLKEAMKEQMIEDEHGKSTICNIYFDTTGYDLIRHSITKPVYKDKVRLRSYNIPTLDSNIYLEIKKKYDGVVGKRRIQMKLNEFYEYLNNEEKEYISANQIKNEINYYFKYYKLKPSMFVSYYRRAYFGKDDRDFRVTFDSNVIARNYDLKIEKGNYGTNIFEENKYIMEVKTLGSMPMWFVKLLDEIVICPCGFSKYGEGYTQLILKANTVSEYVI